MRILVYGAGVQGCELAHRLAQNEKNTVTLLARGEWKERIDQKGLTIRHWAQLKTTVDRVPTIETLAPEESYDIVFVTVQAGQLPEILPVLKQNKSEFFVFVGNQPHARSVLQAMQRPADKIAFGFQNNGGRRENGQVISVHAGIGMTVGGATAPLSGTFRQRLQAAFEAEGYHALFGKTQGYYGPYVWRETVPAVYQVELPDGSAEYTVNLLKGFVFRSWMDYLTFGRYGTGGWASPDGTINCIEQAYDLESERFRVSLLKHEAQHTVDRKRFPQITPAELEYRAKLVELQMQAHAEKISDLKGVQMKIEWGSQIRSYVFMPYQLVKDNRTGYETSNINAVMDGDLDGFVTAYLTCAATNTWVTK